MTTYREAGVNIAAGNALVDHIKGVAKKTNRPGVLSEIGGFSGLFEIPNLKKYQHPVLVAATDGVGTKLRLAHRFCQHGSIGIDLVAMCVNDIIVQGAEPLFFLDYYATGHLNTKQATMVISGIIAGCQQANVALLGGETAEMRGMYTGDDYDLAGFCVGVVEKNQRISPQKVQHGDQLIALASNGPHSNGYSLINSILYEKSINTDALFSDRSTHNIMEALMLPTRIYVNTVLRLHETIDLHGAAHITGGGLLDNVPRMLPPHLAAQLHQSSWQWPPLFQWLQEQGEIASDEMLHTFNCGVGMVLCTAPEQSAACLERLKQLGETAWIIGLCYQTQTTPIFYTVVLTFSIEKNIAL